MDAQTKITHIMERRKKPKTFFPVRDEEAWFSFMNLVLWPENSVLASHF